MLSSPEHRQYSMVDSINHLLYANLIRYWSFHLITPCSMSTVSMCVCIWHQLCALRQFGRGFGQLSLGNRLRESRLLVQHNIVVYLHAFSINLLYNDTANAADRRPQDLDLDVFVFSLHQMVMSFNQNQGQCARQS